MRVGVTGFTGNIGSKVVTSLRLAGFEVVTIGRALESNLCLDFLSSSFSKDVADIGPVFFDAIIHCAWFTEHPLFWDCSENEVFANNSVHFIEVLHSYNPYLRFVGIGSCAEIYPHRGDIRSLGGAKKYARNCINGIVTQFLWFQVFFAFGPGEPGTKLLSIIRSGAGVDVIRDDQIVLDLISFDVIAKVVVDNVVSQDDVRGVFHLGLGVGYQVRNLIDVSKWGDRLIRYTGASAAKGKVASPSLVAPGIPGLLDWNETELLSWICRVDHIRNAVKK